MTKPTSDVLYKNIMINQIKLRQKIQYFHQKRNLSIDRKAKKDLFLHAHSKPHSMDQSLKVQNTTFQRESFKNHVFSIMRFKFFNDSMIHFDYNQCVIFLFDFCLVFVLSSNLLSWIFLHLRLFPDQHFQILVFLQFYRPDFLFENFPTMIPLFFLPYVKPICS